MISIFWIFKTWEAVFNFDNDTTVMITILKMIMIIMIIIIIMIIMIIIIMKIIIIIVGTWAKMIFCADYQCATLKQNTKRKKGEEENPAPRAPREELL